MYRITESVNVQTSTTAAQLTEPGHAKRTAAEMGDEIEKTPRNWAKQHLANNDMTFLIVRVVRGHRQQAVVIARSSFERSATKRSPGGLLRAAARKKCGPRNDGWTSQATRPAPMMVDLVIARRSTEGGRRSDLP